MNIDFGTRLGVKLGLEDAELMDLPTIDEGMTDVSDNLTDMETTEAPVIDTENKIEVLEGTTDSLERICFALESLQSKQMSKDTTAMFSLALESALQPLGLEGAVSTIINSKQDSDSSEKKTEGMLNKIKEAATKTYEYLKQLIIKLWDSLKSFVVSLFSTAGSMKKTALALIAKARTVKGKSTAPTIRINANGLQKGDKIATPSEIAEHAKMMEDMATTLLIDADSTMGVRLINEFNDRIKKIGDATPDDATFDTHGDRERFHLGFKDVQDLRDIVLERLSTVAKKAGIDSDADAATIKAVNAGAEYKIKATSAKFLGNVAPVLVMWNPAELKKTDKKFTSFINGVKFQMAVTEDKTIERQDIKALSIDELVTNLSTVVNICDAVIKFNDVWFKREKAILSAIDTRMRFRVKLGSTIQNVSLTEHEDKNLRGKSDKEQYAFIAKHGLQIMRDMDDVISGCTKFTAQQSRFESTMAKLAIRNCHALISISKASLDAHASTSSDKAEDATKPSNIN